MAEPEKTVHLVYPHGEKISCPDAIGRNLGRRLADRYRVVYHAWDAPETIRPKPGDVLLGHAHPVPWTCFRLSLRQPGWSRVLLMLPYTHGNPTYNAFIQPFIMQCDLFLTIAGGYWFDSIGESIYSHWLPKMVHLDLAVDRRDFPPLKQDFSPVGERRFLYIGKASQIKNTRYLSRIARSASGLEFGWIGAGDEIPGLIRHGECDFTIAEAQALIASYDFLITVSRADANPATILEAMAWGLVPVCSPQSGYAGYSSILNLPLDDVEGAVKIVRRLAQLPEEKLSGYQAANWKLLEDHFNWERFTAQVEEAIESGESPPIKPISWMKQASIQWYEQAAPYAPWRRPRFLVRTLRRLVRDRYVISGAGL